MKSYTVAFLNLFSRLPNIGGEHVNIFTASQAVKYLAYLTDLIADFYSVEF